MVWKAETSQGFEQRKVRPRIAELLRGSILDVGCGSEKIVPAAVGVDLFAPADILLDLSSPNPLKVFSSDFFDVVFSSHCLEDMPFPKELLRDMFRVLKIDGRLILYLPHKDLYPNVGHPDANPRHKHDFLPEDVIKILESIGPFFLERCETCSEGDEYSFLIVAKKLKSEFLSPFQVQEAKPKQKTAVVCRYGAIGDAIQVTPLLRTLKNDGFHVTVNCTPATACVYENSSCVDDLLLIEKYTIPTTHLHEYHAVLKKKFDLFINLCESIERTLLLEPKDAHLFNLPKWAREKRCNINYTDWILALGGYGHITGRNPELYLSEYEQHMIHLFREKQKGRFLVQWALAGSSWHKIYPFADEIMLELADEIQEIEFYLCGGPEIRMLDFENKKIHPRIGQWLWRQSIIMPSVMDLVIGPESGVINAASAFDTPKICLLTHSSKENLTKYWKNDYSLESEAACHPCHRLVHETEGCPLDKQFNLPVCISEGHPKERLKSRIWEVYLKWRDTRFNKTEAILNAK